MIKKVAECVCWYKLGKGGAVDDKKVAEWVCWYTLGKGGAIDDKENIRMCVVGFVEELE